MPNYLMAGNIVTLPQRRFPKSTYPNASDIPKTLIISGYYNGPLFLPYSGDGNPYIASDDYIDFYLPDAYDSSKTPGAPYNGYIEIYAYWMDGISSGAEWVQFLLGPGSFFNNIISFGSATAVGSIVAGQPKITLTPTFTRPNGVKSFGSTANNNTLSVKYIASTTAVTSIQNSSNAGPDEFPIIMDNDPRWVTITDGVPHTFDVNYGFYYILIRIRNEFGMWNDFQFTAQNLVPNPVAVFTWSEQGDGVHFDGSGSYAFAGRTIAAWAWTFLDQSSAGLGSASTVNPIFDLPEGDNTARLRVTDSAGALSAIVSQIVPVTRNFLPAFIHPLGATHALVKSGTSTLVKEIYTTNALATTISTFTNETPQGLSRSPETGDIYSTTRNTGNATIVRRSSDDGRTWTTMAQPFDSTYKPQGGLLVLHGGYQMIPATKSGNAYVSRSTDGGATYQIILVGTLPTGAKGLSLLQRVVADGDTTLVITDGVTAGAEWQSGDIGDTWTLIP